MTTDGVIAAAGRAGGNTPYCCFFVVGIFLKKLSEGACVDETPYPVKILSAAVTSRSLLLDFTDSGRRSTVTGRFATD
jgi:hypothetical protein